MKGILFFDIDGTLFDDRRNLPDSVLPALEKAHGNGLQLIINTGRTYCNQDHRLDRFPLDGWIMGCGTRIIYHGETIQSMEYEPEQTLRLRSVFLELGIPTVWECDTAMYFDPRGPDHPTIAGFREWAEKRGIRRDISESDPEFRAVKMFCFADRKGIAGLEKRTAGAGMPYTAICRENGAWEMVPEGYSKGSGMEVLRKKLGVDTGGCYAFGDSRNDLTMFEHAGTSIAMGNAADDVKAACSWVTDRPEDDGIANALKHFGLI